MPKKWTHEQAFGHFGTKPRNRMWSWSARSDDGKIVVGIFWQNQFERKDGRLVYDRRSLETWTSKNLGWPEWRENWLVAILRG